MPKYGDVLLKGELELALVSHVYYFGGSQATSQKLLRIFFFFFSFGNQDYRVDPEMPWMEL